MLCVPEAYQTLGEWLADMDPRLEAARAASAEAHHDAFKGDCVKITCMTRVTEGGSELVSAKYSTSHGEVLYGKKRWAPADFVMECGYPSSAAKSWKDPRSSVLRVPEACQTLGKWLRDHRCRYRSPPPSLSPGASKVPLNSPGARGGFFFGLFARG